MSDTGTGFAERLREMAQGSGLIDIAQFAFVGLDEVERAYGDRWPAQKSRVLDVAHTYLSKRLGPADVLIKGGGGFIVLTRSGVGPETSINAASLAHGLNDFFLGAMKEAPAPRVGVQISSVDVDTLVETVGDIAFVSPPPGASDQQPMPSGMDWRFQPVWDVRREALGSYYLAHYVRETQARLPGYQFEPMEGAPKSFASVDEAGLWVAEQALRDLFEKDGRALVGVAVHSSSLTNLASRAKLFNVMENFDKSLLRYKTIKIANVVPGFPRMYLNDILGALRQRVPSVVIGAAWDEPDIAGLLQAGPVAVGFTLPPTVMAKNSLVPLTHLLAKVRSAVETAHAAKKLFFVEGNIPRELVIRLSAIGVDNISSPLVWPTCSAPESVLKWPADRLLSAA